MRINVATMRGLIPAMIGGVLILVLGWAYWPASPSTATKRTVMTEDVGRSSEPVRPLTAAADLDPHKVELGRKLFHDVRLSADGTLSCAGCHDLASGGDDGRPVSVGVKGVLGTLNAPTVFNAALNFRQFWDGRAESLETQVGGPLLSPQEMGATWPQVLAVVAGDPDYSRSFGAIYPAGVTEDAVRDALATFIRSLATPDASFDRYLRGDETAMTERQRTGWRLFKHYGCATCHQGASLGGNMYERMGTIVPWYDERRRPLYDTDLGRFRLTGDEAHRHEFKVPGLRNVARTAPYFHDGSVTTLREAVQLMAWHQLGIRLPAQEIELIVEFLETLTGNYDGKPL